MTVPEATSLRAGELFDDHIRAIRSRVDRLMAGLMVGQWVFAVLIAVVYSPYAWEGRSRSVHPHVYAALLLGGGISSAPIAMALLRPGAALTRYVIAVAQMLWSALLIHLMGGRIEAHFHVFGSLAFLAFYRDIRVLVPATVVVAGDHLVRQLVWPESVYGTSSPEWWRFLEHVFWVLFENLFLTIACVRGVRELESLARQRAEIEEVSRKERERSEQLDWALDEALAAKDAAEKASAIKSQFLANMSHELRTPINGVMGMAELLGRTEVTPKQRKYLDAIQGTGQTLLSVVNDVLDFSKVEAGQLALADRELALPGVASAVADLLEPQAHDKGLALRCVVDADVPELVRGDAGRLQQILVNLVANAIKFTEHGEIVVRASLDGETASDVVVRFEVSDTGIGIAEEHLGTIFEAFRQVDDTNSRKYGGTGLGLSIAKQLAGLMQGEIGVRSALGKGSTFWFTARLAKVGEESARGAGAPGSSREAAAEAAAVPREASGAGPLILLAEDNTVNRRIATEMLEALGYRVDIAANGREATEAVRRREYAAILMDCQMPEMNGYEATMEIRRAWTGRSHLPIIALTARAMEGDREKAIQAGMDDYITKPLTMAKLSEVIARWTAPSRGEAPGPAAASVSPSVTAIATPGVKSSDEPILDSEVRRSTKVIKLFLAELDGWCERLDVLVAAGDLGQIERQAHKLRGGCLSTGALAMARICKELELSPGRASDLSSAVKASAVALRGALVRELDQRAAAAPSPPRASSSIEGSKA